MMEEPVLKVEHLNVWYDNQREGFLYSSGKSHVVKDLSFSIQKREILGLLGESGSGKSTVARAVLGLIKDVDGNIAHYSKNPQMVFQDPYSSLNPAKKVAWLLQEPLRQKGGYSRKEREEKMFQMLEKVGLKPEMAERYPSQLSGGQRQRVCIGAALMLEPELLIADEAVSALDVTIQAQILDLLQALHEEMGLAILFISHDLRVVYRMCPRVLIMKEGRIIEHGNTEQIFFDPKQEYTKELLKASGIMES